jgi:hypothetical protein
VLFLVSPQGYLKVSGISTPVRLSGHIRANRIDRPVRPPLAIIAITVTFALSLAALRTGTRFAALQSR